MMVISQPCEECIISGDIQITAYNLSGNAEKGLD